MPVGGETVGRAYVLIVADGSDLDESIRREFDKADPTVRKAGKRHAKEYRKGFDEDRHPILAKFDREIQAVATRLGKAFGRGSRNDFLNFTGGVVQGLANIGRILPRSIAFFQDWGRSIRDAEGVGRTLLATFSPILKTVGKVGLAFAGLHLLIGPLVSAMSLLGGIISALAGSIAFSLVGALGVLSAVAVPATAAIVTLGFALGGLSVKAKKAMAIRMKPVLDQFKGLREVTRKGLFGDVAKDAQIIAPVLRGLRPLFFNLGKAVRDVGTSWFKAMRGKGFTTFRDAMTRFLPDAIRKLGVITKGFFGGLGGILRAMIPTMNRVLDSLTKSAQEFSKWANSAKGQNQIKKFFDDGMTSLKAFGGFLGSVKDLLDVIIVQGRKTGDSIFGDMSRAIDGWTAKLHANPDILGNWFRSARKFAGAIGDLVLGVGRFFDSLDTGLSRGEITAAFRGLGAALTIVAHVLEGIGHVIGPVVTAFGKLPTHVQTLAVEAGIAAFAFSKLQGSLVTTRANMSGFAAGVRNTETRMATLSAGARNVAGPAGLLLMASAATATSKKMRVLGDAAAGALLGFSIGGPVGAAIGGLAGALVGLDSNIEKVKTSLLTSRQAIRLYKASLDPLTGAITAQTRQTVFAQVNKEMPGFISQLHRAGVQSRDVISATLGNVNAQQRIRSILGKNSTLWNLMQGIIHDTGGQFQKAAHDARESANATSSWQQALKGLPKNVVTKLRADGFKETRADLLKIITTSKNLSNKQIKILLRAFGIDQTIKDFRRTVKAAQEAGHQKPKPKISLDHIQYDRQVLAAVKAALGLDRQRPTPKSSLKDGTTPIAKKVIDLLNLLNSRHPRPTVTVSAGAAIATIDAVNHKLSLIQDQSATITTYYKSLGPKKKARGGLMEGLRGIGIPVTVGEAGPEAIVPLDRPLSQVDPSVRLLSAFAQGKLQGLARGGVAGGGKNVDMSGWTIISPNTDTEAVAQEVANRAVAQMY